jgi:hypothetical protein
MNKLLEINRELREIPDPKISNISVLTLKDLVSSILRSSRKPMGTIETTLRKLMNT